MRTQPHLPENTGGIIWGRKFSRRGFSPLSVSPAFIGSAIAKLLRSVYYGAERSGAVSAVFISTMVKPPVSRSASMPFSSKRFAGTAAMTSDQPMSCTDKSGREFHIRRVGETNADELKDMYDSFTRYSISQGLPPANPEIRAKWIDKLLEFGINLIAHQDDRPVGHSAIIPDYARGDAEFIIFVHDGYRNKGIGTALTNLAVEISRSEGLNRVWLTVEPYNFRAIALYRNAGFTFIEEGDTERAMMLRL